MYKKMERDPSRGDRIRINDEFYVVWKTSSLASRPSTKMNSSTWRDWRMVFVNDKSPEYGSIGMIGDIKLPAVLIGKKIKVKIDFQDESEMNLEDQLMIKLAEVKEIRRRIANKS